MENLDRVLHTLSVDPDGPADMCTMTSSPSQLLYQNTHAMLYRVRRVDCSTTPPTLKEEAPIVHDYIEYNWSMCTSGDLLVIARYCEGVFAYTQRSGQLKWKVAGELPGIRLVGILGVTADEQGHLYVCSEVCTGVLMLSALDGSYLGMVLSEGVGSITTPYRIAWHRESASLILDHQSDGDRHLSVFSRLN